MFSSPRSRVASGVMVLLGVAGVLVAPATALAGPQTLLPHAATAAPSGGFSSYSSGDIVYANAANLPPLDVAKASTGQSAAAAGAPLVSTDQLQQPLLTASKTGKTAYGHSSGLNVGLLTGVTKPPQVAQTLVEATSPSASTRSGNLLALPVAPLLSATVLPSAVTASSLAAGSCVTGKDISNGGAHVANATILNAGTATTVGQLDGTSDTLSHTKLITPTRANGTTVTTGKSGLLGETTLTLAPLTLLQGTPLAITVDVLKDIRLSAAAGGVPGTSVISYGAVGATSTTPILKLTIAGQSVTLTSQQVFGPTGLTLALGVLDITIGAPAHALTGLEGSAVTQAANGTAASAAADFIRVSLPGKLPVPTANPLGSGPLKPLGDALAPVLNTLGAALTPLQNALISAGLNVADIREGHLEASTAVPVGGISCDSGNPLTESRKDVSAAKVAPGGTFDYDIRVPNRGTSPITNVKVVDTYSAELGFLSSVPAPASKSGHTLTYDLGTIAPNAFRTITLTFKVPDSASAGTVYRNSAVITGTYLGQPITITVVVPGPTVGSTPTGACDLSGSSKFASNLKVKTGEDFGYLINVLNSGGSSCLATTVKDTLLTGVSFVSCTAGCTHSGQVVTWNLGTLKGGESRVLAVIVKVIATSGTLPNTVAVTSPSGTSGHPSTTGPTVTTTTVPAPGDPATASGEPTTVTGALPRTGLGTGGVALGLLSMMGTGIYLRTRRRA